MSMPKIGKAVLNTLHGDAIISIWDEAFGRGLSNKATLEIKLHKILRIACDHLNFKGRSGDMSLFRRDPFKDRIVLVASTVDELNPGKTPSFEHFPEIRNNYDPVEKVCYVDLNDRLVQDGRTRNDAYCRKSRGLTGFVCVAPCSLIVLGNAPEPVIRSQFPTDGEFLFLLEKYGPPERGCNICESSYKAAVEAKQQYMVVPVESTASPRVVIGVLRYVAPLSQPHLDSFDLGFLGEVARVISAVICEFKQMRNNTRQIEYRSAAEHFQAFGNLSQFLRFVTESLSSKIASVYVSFHLNGRQTLRLLEAWGISDSVSTLRRDMALKDYTAQTLGLTWSLFSQPTDEPKVLVVFKDTSWRGINMKTFYKRVFESKGISFSEEGSDLERRQFSRQYSIMLIGSPLRSEGSQPTGVFKVEFPTDYDNEDYYNEEDREFFKTCCKTLIPEIALLSSFLDISWFNPNYSHNGDQFIRLFSNVVGSALVLPVEKPEFWARAEKFINQQPETFRRRLRISLLKRFQQDNPEHGNLYEFQEQLNQRLPSGIAESLSHFQEKTASNAVSPRSSVHTSANMNHIHNSGNIGQVIIGKIEGVVEHHNLQFHDNADYRITKEFFDKSDIPDGDKKDGLEILNHIEKKSGTENSSISQRAKIWVEKNERFLGAMAGTIRKCFGLDA